ncbi:MAG: hypothetical protein IT317_03025 [Anaerolineales bacterium]|nr:hypothetical protein [Anaerolineales bacterium]
MTDEAGGPVLTAVEAFWLQWQAEEGSAAAASTARRWLAAIQGGGDGSALHLPDAEAVAAFREMGLAQLVAPTLADLEDSAARANRHVQGVAATALKLFDITRPLHRLKPAARRRMESAARLHQLAGPGPAQSAACLEALPPSDVGPRELQRLTQLLRAAGRGLGQAAVGPAALDTETKALAALLQLADTLDYDQDQATPLESATLTPQALSLRVRGLGGAAVAARVRLCRRFVKAGLNTGLRVSVAAPTLDQVRPLLAEPTGPRTPVGRAVQRGVAEAVIAWQAALANALSGEAAALRRAERETARTRQALGAWRAMLKRKAAQQLRNRLRTVQRTLRAASEARQAAADGPAYAAGLTREHAAGLPQLLERLDQTAARAGAAAEAWIRGAAAAELCEDLLALVAAPPLRAGTVTTVRQSAEAILKEAAETTLARLEDFGVNDPRRQRRLSEALVRGQAALAALGGAATFGPGAAALEADWKKLEQRVEQLRALTTLDAALGAFLDDWALRQAKRKAPQLSGVEAVIAYRKLRRAERQAQRKLFLAEARPVQGRRLLTRVRRLAAALKAQR